MGVCVPTHKVCGWFDPEIDSGFVAGPTPCVLQSFTEFRSRASGGGTFFRSVTPGVISNQISVQIIVDNNPANFNNPSPPVGVNVELTVENLSTSYLEYYYVYQEYDGIDDLCISNGVTLLRSAVNNDAGGIISMPPDDTIQPWDAGVDDSDCLLSSLGTTFLSGGVSGPLDPGGAGIRTGPAQSLVHIGDGEDVSNKLNTGALIEINEVRYWNGSCWLNYDPLLPDCEDPNSPPDCSGGPASECA